MSELLAVLSPQFPSWGLWLIVAFVVLYLLLVGRCFVFIPNDSYGVIERRWSLRKGKLSG